MAVDTPVLGDFELEEIMKMVGGDIGVAPEPPAAKAKVETPAETPAEVPVEEVAEPTPAVPVDEDTSSAEEAELDSELEALLASVEEPKDEEPLVKVTKATEAEEDTLEAAIRSEIGEIEVAVVPETELPESVLEALEAPNVVETPIVTSEPAKEASTPVETKHSHPLAMDDDDFEPVKRDGVVYYIDPARLKRDVAFSPHNIDDAMMTHASKFVHYAVQSSLARGQFERMKAAFEILESKLDGEHRLVLKEENPKTTEAQIRAAVVSDERWKAANARLIETRTVYELAQDAKEAFTMRRDTLLQVAKNVREERGGQLRLEEIREEQKGARQRVLDKLAGSKTGTADA